tara:strand:- start:11904 stop:12764 length:861 start_codon:yes stop_codon:yes gene_type:complete
MRKWYKYLLVYGGKKDKIAKKHQDFSDYEVAMGGYGTNEYYSDQNNFNIKYLLGRFKYNHEYLNRHLNQNMKILSIASGRCINELQFIFKKYNITCSDLDVPKSYVDARKIFGEFDYKKLNILNTSLTENYNCIIALGLVYAFSEEDYKNFFNNVNRSLNLDGELILDSSSSENNFITFLFDRVYLKYETFFISKILNFLGKTNSVVTRHHGYKFKNNEIIKMAQKHGFSLINKESKDNLTEISRSKIAEKLMNKIPFTKYFFCTIGATMPYLRYFKFKKTKNIIV